MAEHIANILAQLLDPADAVRDAAEKQLDACLANQGQDTALALLELICSPPNSEVQEMAAVLFRRYCSHLVERELSFWAKCAPEAQEGIKSGILGALSGALPSRRMRRKVADCAAAIVKAISVQAANESEAAEFVMPSVEHFWPNLVTMLWQMAQANDADQLDGALAVFVAIPGLFGPDAPRHTDNMIQLLSMALNHADVEVRVSGAKATKAFVTMVDKRHWPQYVELVKLVLELIKQCLLNNEEASAVAALECLAEVAELEPKMLRPIVPDLVETLVSVCNTEAFEDSCRKLALEVIVLLCESASSMMRKLEGLADKLLHVCLGFLMTVDFEDGWSQIDKPVEDDEEDLAVAAEWAIDRIANSLHGNVLLPPAFAVLPGMLENEDWRQRYVACLAIAGIGEGCRELMKQHLDPIVEKVVPLLADAVPFVRYSACSAIGQMSIDFCPHTKKETKTCFQERFHEPVLNGLVGCLNGSEGHFRVQGHSIGALTNFCEHINKVTLSPYLDSILTALGNCLSVPSILVQETAVTALATMADTARKHFVKYYTPFIGHMKTIIASATGEEHKMLRAKTLECATLMGVAVGKEMFANDAIEIMNVLKTMEDAGMKSDDPQIAYTLTSWARLCEVLQEDFVPFLEYVLPPLVRTAQLSATICALDEDESQEDLPDGGNNWEVLELADTRIGIKTSALEEKRVACDMLVTYARHLGPHFAPHVQDMSFVLPLLKFVFEEGVRTAAANLIPFLIKAYVENPHYGIEPAVELWNTAWPDLVTAACKESELDVVTYMLMSLSQCVAVLEERAFSAEMLAAMVQLITTVMTDFQEMAEHRYTQLQGDEDLDEEAMAELSQDEQERYMVVAEAAGLIHVLYGYGKAQFDPYFDQVAPFFVAMLGGQRHPKDINWALCVFDDVIEHSPQHSLNYAAQFAEPMVAGLEHPDYEIRQAASYGIGQMAAKGAGNYTEVCTAALPKLYSLIQAEGSRIAPASAATDNAIATLVRLAQAGDCGLTEAALVPDLCSWMPLTEDEEEMAFVMGYFMDLIAASSPLIADPALMLKIVMAMCSVIGDEDLLPLEDETGVRVAQFLQMYLTQGDKNVVEQVRAYIAQDAEMSERIQALMAA